LGLNRSARPRGNFHKLTFIEKICQLKDSTTRLVLFDDTVIVAVVDNLKFGVVTNKAGSLV